MIGSRATPHVRYLPETACRRAADLSCSRCNLRFCRKLATLPFVGQSGEDLRFTAVTNAENLGPPRISPTTILSHRVREGAFPTMCGILSSFLTHDHSSPTLGGPYSRTTNLPYETDRSVSPQHHYSQLDHSVRTPDAVSDSLS